MNTQLNIKEYFENILGSLKKIQNCLVIVSLGMPTGFDGMLLQLFSKTIKIKQSYNALSVHIDDLGKTQSILLDSNTLETIPQH